MPLDLKPDSTAVRVALWRALHVQIDPPPHVLGDEIGLRLVAPEEGWRNRPDMNPQFTRVLRAWIVARARFIEDLVIEEAGRDVRQYVLLGAGLDTFVQRRPDVAHNLHVFEVDRPESQAWKRKRLVDLGFGVPEWLHFVPVDFERGGSWRDRLKAEGFHEHEPTVVASIGVSMYLTKDANTATLRQVATLAPGSKLAMTFMPPLELLDPPDRPLLELAQKGAAASGTPFLSWFTPPEMLALAHHAGFPSAYHVSPATLAERYFSGRFDGLRPSSGEDILVATT